MTHPLRYLGCLLGLALTAPAVATDIYRCGPEGATTYAQTPCAEGRRVDVADVRNDEQRQQATQVHERTTALASTMAHDRQVYDAAHPPAGAAGFHMPDRKQAIKVASSRSSKVKKAQAQRLRQTEATKRRTSRALPQEPVRAPSRD